MEEENISLGLRISFYEPLTKEELDMMFEKGIYPAAIRFPLSIEYLAGHGNHYFKHPDESTYGVFYQIKLEETDMIHSINVDGKEIKVVSTEINERNNDADFINKEKARYKVSEYINGLKGMLEDERALV